MIGVFDSGSGGLTVLRAIRDALPSTDIVYFGDTKNAPYGSKGREELSKLTLAAFSFLQSRGATSIVSACNSVSASLAVSLFDAFDIAPQHLIEMVGPTVAYFRGSTVRLLLVATPATIKSDIYQSAFKMIGKDVLCIAIPELAGAIELGKGSEEHASIIRAAFSGIELRNYDALVLACTHYPLALSAFKNAVGDGLVLFDPAEAVAERVERRLWPREAGDGKMTFVISEDSPVFRAFVERLFSKDKYSVEVLE
jgi:glutamate racemase